MLITSGPEDRLALSCKDYIGGINAGPCALNIMDILFGDCWCIITHLVDSCCIISEIKCHRTPTHVTKAFFSLSFSLWQLWCKWGVKSSWYAWVCPPGHSPLGSSTSFVSRAGGQECVSNVHMNKCSSVTFPHVKEEGVLQSTQLDSPNWHFDLTHLHMSHSTAGSCMFHCNGAQSHVWIIT